MRMAGNGISVHFRGGNEVSVFSRAIHKIDMVSKTRTKGRL